MVSQGFLAFLSQCRSMGRGRGGLPLPPPPPMALTGTFSWSAPTLFTLLFGSMFSFRFGSALVTAPHPPPPHTKSNLATALFRLNGQRWLTVKLSPELKLWRAEIFRHKDQICRVNGRRMLCMWYWSRFIRAKLACSRFADSGEDAKVKLPFYFHVRTFSIPADPTISEPWTG